MKKVPTFSHLLSRTLPWTLGGIFFLSLFSGAYHLSVAEVVNILFRPETAPPNLSYLIWEIRLPRILIAGLTGAGLAITGACIQGLFRNPLADPGLVGINSGAMLFAAWSIVMLEKFLEKVSGFWVNLSVSISAFTGALLTTFLIYAFSKHQGRSLVMSMLLAGIAISAFAAALTGLMIYVSDEQQLRDFTFWTLGSFNSANWLQLMIVFPVVLLGILLLNRLARPLNAILLGEQEAAYLGIEVESVKRKIIVLTALIVGVCIAFSGLIGFVGLIIPHFLRLLEGSDYRKLLQRSAWLGATFMILSDLVSRTVIAPAELPVGIITALIGAPFFIWLLFRARKEWLPI